MPSRRPHIKSTFLAAVIARVGALGLQGRSPVRFRPSLWEAAETSALSGFLQHKQQISRPMIQGSGESTEHGERKRDKSEFETTEKEKKNTSKPTEQLISKRLSSAFQKCNRH